MAVNVPQAAGPETVHDGRARARAAEAVVDCLRRHVGRGPDRARAAFLGTQTVAVELGGSPSIAEGTPTELRSELGTAVAGALGVEATCTSWVIDADADTMLLVFALREPPRR